MKAANGGLLHTLFDYSHPFLLGGKSRRPVVSSSRPPSRPSTSHAICHSLEVEETTMLSSPGVSPNSALGSSPDGGGGAAVEGGHGRRLGRWLPRTLLVHGMADATVPFAQTAAIAAALKVLGVPTTVRFEPGGAMVVRREWDDLLCTFAEYVIDSSTAQQCRTCLSSVWMLFGRCHCSSSWPKLL